MTSVTIVKRKNVISKTHLRGNKSLISNSGGFRLLSPLGVTSVFQSKTKPESSEEKRSNQQAFVKAVVSQICMFGRGEPCEILLPIDTNIWTEFPDGWEESETGLELVSNTVTSTMAESGLLLVSGISK